MPKIRLAQAVLLSTFGAFRPAAATEPAVTGTWLVSITQPGTDCQWDGRIVLQQDGRTLSGTGTAEVARAHRSRCPTLAGTITGEVNGPAVNFGFATGKLGTARFRGTLDTDQSLLQGRWSTRSALGFWQAQRRP